MRDREFLKTMLLDEAEKLNLFREIPGISWSMVSSSEDICSTSEDELGCGESSLPSPSRARRRRSFLLAQRETEISTSSAPCKFVACKFGTSSSSGHPTPMPAADTTRGGSALLVSGVGDEDHHHCVQSGISTVDAEHVRAVEVDCMNEENVNGACGPDRDGDDENGARGHPHPHTEKETEADRLKREQWEREQEELARQDFIRFWAGP